MPEVDLKDGHWKPNPFAKRIALEGMTFNGRGRPRKGQGSGPTTTRSVRFPAAFWKRVEQKAKAEGMSVHGALRMVIAEWVSR